MTMAGKLHTGYLASTTASSTAASPYSKRKRAYAEGFNANRAAVLRTSNPHPAWQSSDPNSDYVAWDNGWMDSSVPYPPTHVG
jgi:hypothetical protein